MVEPIREPVAMSGQVPVEWREVYPVSVCDINKRNYIDFTSGILVANVGHQNANLRDALAYAIDYYRPLHTYTFPNAPRRDLCKRLTDLTGFEKLALFSTGSEAVEAAIRAARAYSGRPDIVSWIGSMHGKTLGAKQLMHGGPKVVRQEWTCRPVDQWTPYICIMPAAVIVETYHGWGARWYPKGYIQDVAGWCKDNGALLIFDEVQAGYGRTGKMWGYEWYDVQPDMIVIGKGMGGGMPISGVLGPAAVLDADPDMSSTHSGNPVCCAAALAVLDIMEREKLVDRALEIGEIVKDAMIPIGLPLHGRGAAWAVWLNDYPRYHEGAIEQANRIVDLAAERGVLLLKTGCGTIKLGPPLVIPWDQLRDGLRIIRECIEEVVG